MNRKFAGQLENYIQQTGLSLRHLARMSGIPHQTIFNWTKGTQPRGYPGLKNDLDRLGKVLGLDVEDIIFLKELAGCIEGRTNLIHRKEIHMETTYRIPKGWFITGETAKESSEQYQLGVDPEKNYNGQHCITIEAEESAIDFAGLAQQVKADYYLGKRVQFTAMIEAENIQNRAALFMRVSDENGKLLAFDNMRNRFIHESQDWKRHSIVLDVDKEADNLVFGILLSGPGKIWFAEPKIEVVDKNVPTTDILEEITPFFPINLDFSE